MRTLPPPLAEAFTARPRRFIGERKLAGRVTVQPDWYLHTQTSGLGLWPAKKAPIRYFQTAANSQVEVEIPNVLSINRDKSIDNVAPTCDIVFRNQKMNSNAGIGHTPTELGNPGFYTWNRGRTAEARARWGHVPNEWQNLLVQDALIRVYQGIVGPGPESDDPVPAMSIPDAVAAGYLMLRFVGLVDSVRITTDGKMTLKCRGMSGGLLVDTDVDYPLVPLDDYPMVRSRWAYNNVALNAAARDVTSRTTSSINEPPGDRPCSYYNSSTDDWSPTYGGGGPGSNSPLHGHYPSDSLDSDDGSFWLGNGNSRADALFAFDWLEYDCGGEAVNSIYLSPWMGNYTMFVSVLENGVWQGADVIPYDPSELYGTQATVDTGAAIPYVASYGVPMETPQEYPLPRMYAAQRIRITFHDLFFSQWGPWRYRAGVREFRPRISSGTQTTVANVHVEHLEPVWLTAEAHPESGYWTVDQLGQVDAFGAARTRRRSIALPTNDNTWAIRGTPDGNGYYTLEDTGRVLAYGDAVHHGDLPGIGVHVGVNNDQAMDLVVTPDGGGYWIVRFGGHVNAFGNATNYTATVPVTPNAAIAGCEGDGHGGLWVLDTAGAVHAYGVANHGSYSPVLPAGAPNRVVEIAVSIRRTKNGDGYWILTSEGRVQHFGAAPNLGGVATPKPTTGDWRLTMWELIRNPTADIGYLILRGDGTIFPIGTVDFYGGPASGSAEQRSDGNFTELSQIWRDLLLYAGYWLKEPLGPGDEPKVFGILETTGTWVNSPLTAAFFDKKPIADVIKALLDIVGYQLLELDDGGIRITSPNFWMSGNFDENSVHTDYIPEVDERVDMTGLAVELPAKPLRSPIIIGNSKIDPHDPYATVHVEYTPPYAGLLRGMCRRASWTQGGFMERSEMQIMAELISLRIWFQLRLDGVDAWMRPDLEPDTQVRLWERQTGETGIHYIRSINDTMDLEKGTWTCRLVTNWLGTHEKWAITADHVDQSEAIIPDQFPISPMLALWLRREGIRNSGGQTTIEPWMHNPLPAGSQTGTGAAAG